MRSRIKTLRAERVLEMDEHVSADRIAFRMRIDPSAPALCDRISVDVRLGHPAHVRVRGRIGHPGQWSLCAADTERTLSPAGIYLNPFQAARDWLHDQFGEWDAGPPWLEVGDRIESLARMAVLRCDRRALRRARHLPVEERFAAYRKILAARARGRRPPARRR